jgi:hypothetical protein
MYCVKVAPAVMRAFPVRYNLFHRAASLLSFRVSNSTLKVLPSVPVFTNKAWLFNFSKRNPCMITKMITLCSFHAYILFTDLCIIQNCRAGCDPWIYSGQRMVNYSSGKNPCHPASSDKLISASFASLSNRAIKKTFYYPMKGCIPALILHSGV